MNAPVGKLTISRVRTAREQVDALLLWHADLSQAIGDEDRTPDDLERSARAALMAADRMAEQAREEGDPDTRAVFLSVAGRYALKARACVVRALELRTR